MNFLRFYKYLVFILYLFSATAMASTLTIQVTGIEGKLVQNVQTRLKAIKPQEVTAYSVEQFMKSARDEIRAGIAPYGYYSPHISSNLVTTRQGWNATFHVEQGQAVFIRHIDIQIRGAGANNPAIIQWRNQIQLKPGQIFNSEDYVNAKNNFFTVTNDYGYLRAKLIQNHVNVDVPQHSADIILIVDTGPQFYFGDMHFNANPLSDKFLRRFADFSPGEPYRADKMRDFQQNLNDSNYFQSVLVTPRISAENQTVPINVNVKARKSQHYLLGLGYGTDTGIRATLGTEFRYLTPSGQKFNAQLQASQVLTNLQANYIIPGKNPATDQYSLGAAVGREDQVSGDGSLQKLVANYLTSKNGWQRTVALTLQRERYTLLNQPEQTAVMLIPSINWLKVKSDNPLRPTRGTRIDITVLGSPALFYNSSFAQAALNVKRIQPLSDNFRIVARGNLGVTAISNINNLPLSYQLFAGGSESVRGYPYNSIGPGKFQTVGSVELQRRIKDNWYLGTFYDVGSVDNQFLSNLKRGVGLNLLWQSPIGALQLSVARAVSVPGQPTSIQFSMGPAL